MDILLKTLTYLMEQVFSLTYNQNRIIEILSKKDLLNDDNKRQFAIEHGKHIERLKSLIETWNKNKINFPFRRP